MEIKGKKYYFGFKKQPHDHRDLRYEEEVEKKFGAKEEVAKPAIPPKADIRNLIKRVKKQGDLGSCTAQGTTSLFEAIQVKKIGSDVPGSRLQLYQDTRVLEGSYTGKGDDDVGATIRGTIKATFKCGIAHESMWPYITRKFDDPIPDDVRKAALTDRSLKYYLVDSRYGCNQTLKNVKRNIGVSGIPVVFGTPVYAQIERVGPNGILNYPRPDEAEIGGHCMLWVGYDDAIRCLLTLNSWGTSWGNAGYCLMPYEYITNGLASDCWIITEESGLK